MTALKNTVQGIFAIVVLFGYSLGALADVAKATDNNDVILAGHDPVAYFTEGKPVKGRAEFTAQYDGAVYRFVGAANRDLPANIVKAEGQWVAIERVAPGDL